MERLEAPHPCNQCFISQDPSRETALGGTRGECGVGLVDSARVSRCVSICFKTAGSSMAAMIDEKFT